MSSELARLRAAAARFDDEALAAFASAGLVRRGRKLLDAGPPDIEEWDGRVEVRGNGWAVRVGSGAILTAAVCDCASAGACQHLVAAILALQSGTTEVEGSDPDSVGAGLLTLDLDTLREGCGTAGLRWALDRLATIEDGDVTVDDASYLTISLPAPLPTVRFMQASAASAVVVPAGRHDARVVALAVLFLHRREGRVLPVLRERRPPAGRRTERTAALDAARVASEAVELGLLHLPESFDTRLGSIAAGLRGAGWYRLARLAERATVELDGLERGHAAADVAVLLSMLAEQWVVAGEIVRCIDSGTVVPPALVGSARAIYEPVGALELVGAGHARWGDALFGGTMVVFVDVRSPEVYVVSVADRVRGMSQGAGLQWQGAPALTDFAGVAVRLSGAKASEDRRLSNSSGSSVSVTGPVSPARWTTHPWNGAMPASPSRLHSRRGVRWGVIRVDESGPGAFDPVGQVFRWQVRSAGQEVGVEAPYREGASLVIDSLERAIRRHPSHVIGQLRHGQFGVVLDPLSVVVDAELVVLAVGAGSVRHAQPTPPPSPTVVPSRPTDLLRSMLMRIAERGLATAGSSGISGLATAAADHGFTTLASVARSAATPTAALLRSAWVIDEHDRIECPTSDDGTE